MSMRGRPSRSRDATLLADVRAFAWSPALVAVLRHSSLPWHQQRAQVITLENAVPLEASRRCGRRDALSLVAQYAAHRAFLRFAGIPDHAFLDSEWAVEIRRGRDPRLVRIAVQQQSSDDILPLVAIETFAEYVGISDLATFHSGFERPEAVYAEITRTLAEDVKADLTYLRAAAAGAIAEPGPEAVADLLSGAARDLVYRFPATMESVAFAAGVAGLPLMVIGRDASPLVHGSAFPERCSDPAKLAQTLIPQAGEPRWLAIVNWASFDSVSREAVKILRSSAAGIRWILPAQAADADASDQAARLFVVAPHLRAAAELQRRVAMIPEARRRSALDEWSATRHLDAFVTTGAVHGFDDVLPEIGEPRRSWLAALSLLGDTTPVEDGLRMLQSLGFSGEPEDIVTAGVVAIEGDHFVFASPDAAAHLQRSIPEASRAQLCRVAASLATAMEPQQRAMLFARGGDFEHAAQALEEVEWNEWTASRVVETLAPFPEAVFAVSPQLGRHRAMAHFRCGRYRTVEQVAQSLSLSDRHLIDALVERRRGGYSAALRQLEAVEPPGRDFEWFVLMGELLRVEERYVEADGVLRAAAERAESSRDRERVQFEQSLLAIDSGTPAGRFTLTGTRAQRLRFYERLANGDAHDAVDAARSAVAQAADFIDAIDASVDLVFALFVHGSWDETQNEAMRALARAEEAEGDRAAAGVAFTLAFLWADEGRHEQAAHLVARLRRFYDEREDAKRREELDLIAASIALARLDFDEAAALAGRAKSRGNVLIREAAAWILDEVAWVTGVDAPAEQKGSGGSAELAQRLMISSARRDGDVTPADGFANALVQWEGAVRRAERAPDAPRCATAREESLLLRSCIGLLRRVEHPSVRAEMDRLAAKLHLDPPARATSSLSREAAALEAAATAEYPFDATAFGSLRWSLVQRNRLGQWTHRGSDAVPDRAQLDALLVQPEDGWKRCGESMLLRVHGWESWRAEAVVAFVAMVALRDENYRLRRLIDQEQSASASADLRHVDGIIGESPQIQDLVTMIHRISLRDVPVCILGESGTGKELVARAVHRQSSRRSRPFTPVNCAALPENLIESELFGHVRGAFTGADRDRAGLVESTDGGTLFLDEIGELPLPAQAKLLRFLQEGEIRRVGDTVSRKADVRIVAATNRKLEAAVDAGTFREDLYYRITGIELNVPPLRDRGSDVVILARHFLAEEHRKHRGGADRLARDVELLFASYNWPGNVRELQNTIRAAHALAGERREIDLEHLPARLRGVAIIRRPSGTYFEEILRFRKQLVEDSLTQSSGNQNQAARLLGISRQALAYQIRELGISVVKR